MGESILNRALHAYHGAAHHVAKGDVGMPTRLAAGVVALALGLSGCSLLERPLPEETPNANPAGSSGTRALTLVDWGVVDGLLSVRLRNTTDRTLDRASALVTIRLADGVSMRSGPAVLDDECCTLLGVPPRSDFGVYVDLGGAAGTTDDVDAVEVTYTELAWAPPPSAEEKKPAPTLDLGSFRLETGEGGAEVVTEITAEGGDVAAVAGQAFLTTADGSFLAVVSGRFKCFAEDQPRKVVMELFHSVPEDTVVETVVAYPIPASSASDETDCPG